MARFAVISFACQCLRQKHWHAKCRVDLENGKISNKEANCFVVVALSRTQKMNLSNVLVTQKEVCIFLYFHLWVEVLQSARKLVFSNFSFNFFLIHLFMLQGDISKVNFREFERFTRNNTWLNWRMGLDNLRKIIKRKHSCYNPWYNWLLCHSKPNKQTTFKQYVL